MCQSARLCGCVSSEARKFAYLDIILIPELFSVSIFQKSPPEARHRLQLHIWIARVQALAVPIPGPPCERTNTHSLSRLLEHPVHKHLKSKLFCASRAHLYKGRIRELICVVACTHFYKGGIRKLFV